MKTQSHPNYSIDYFIEKFSAIPARQWTTCTFCDNDGRRCAVGHFLKLEVPDGKSLWDFNHNGRVLREETRIKLRAFAQLFNDCNDMSKAQRTLYAINNGDDFRYKQRSPKQRILTALRDIKARAEAALDAYESRPLKPFSPVCPPERVNATDGPVSCEYLAGSAVAGRQA